ncbi:MAG: S8 family serine peptidase [Candidatus Brockarchaeota archaeon]|nr:S8 family serine peptidase [Candidatus Brockarchaeota archaeon]
MIVDEDLFKQAFKNPDGLFKIVVWSGSFRDDFIIGADASKEKGSKLLEAMRIPMLEEILEEIYSIYGFIPAVVGKMRGRNILSLARLHTVLPFFYKIEPVRLVRTCLKNSVPLIHADTVHERGVLGEGVKVGVIDSGVDPSCSLRGKVISYRNFVPEEEYGDYAGHGTHVAGIIAGDEEVYHGVAPKAKLISAKVMNKEGIGDDHLIADGMLWTYVEGAEIMNLSFGGEGGPQSLLSRMCDALVTKGIVTIVAAGNDGPGEGTIKNPGCSKSVITVGAVDKRGRLVNYSSRGPVNGIMKPELVAPGGLVWPPHEEARRGGYAANSPDESIISARSNLSSRLAYPDECHTPSCGTSMAAPHVSGAAALILEVVKKRGIVVENKHFFVKKVLMETATDLGYGENEQGKGLINVDKALGSMRAYSAEEVTQENVARVANDLASILVPSAIIGTFVVLLGALLQPQKQDVRNARTYYQELYSRIDAILRALEERIHTLNMDYTRGVIPPSRYSEEMMKINRILFELNELIKKSKNIN